MNWTFKSSQTRCHCHSLLHGHVHTRNCESFAKQVRICGNDYDAVSHKILWRRNSEDGNFGTWRGGASLPADKSGNRPVTLRNRMASSMFSATDIASFLACPHTVTLARAESTGNVTKPFFKDPAVELLQKLGIEHERRYLRNLTEKDGVAIVQIDVKGLWERCRRRDSPGAARRRGCRLSSHISGRAVGRSFGLPRSDRRSQRTRSVVLRGRGDQARTFHQGDRLGSALLLLGLAGADSGIGAAVDARCAGRHVESRTVPRSTVRRVLPQGARANLIKAWKLETETYPEPTQHCEVCSWFPICDKRRKKRRPPVARSWNLAQSAQGAGWARRPHR